MGALAMTELPAGFVLEKDRPASQETPPPPSLPPGFVLEGGGGGGNPPEEERTTSDLIRDIVVSAAGGASFETIDEMAALGRTVYDFASGSIKQEQFGDRYSQVLNVMRERQKGIAPEIAIPAEIGGGVASAVALAPAVAAAVPARVAQVAKQLPGWAKAAGLGSLFGGAYGFGGSEEGLEERATGAGYGAAAGGVMGGIGYPIAKGAQIGIEKLGTSIKSRIFPESTARAKIIQAFERDEITINQARSRLRELGPQATIADAGGRNVAAVAGNVARQPGPAQNRAEIMLTQRAEGEAGRIVQAVKKGLDPQDFYAAEDAFLNNLRTRAAPFYKEVYEKYTDLTSRALNRILNSKTGQRALREAVRITENERASGSAAYVASVDAELTVAARVAADVGKMEKVGLPGVSGGLSLQTWDQIKRGFDAVLDGKAYRNEITGKMTTLGRSVNMMRKGLLKELDKLTGGEKSLYAKARKTYAGDAEVLTALRDGRKALKMDPEQITRQLAELSESGREAYRSGAARALKDKVDDVVDKGSAADRIFNTTRKRARIRAIFPDQKSYNLLRKSLIAEQRFTKLYRESLTGSPTQQRQAQAADALTELGGMAGVITAGVGPGHTLLKAGIFRRLGKALLGGSPDAHNLAIAKTLFNRNQAMNQHALDTLFDPTVWKALPEVARKQLGRALLLGMTQQIGQTVAVKGVAADSQ